jgi:putative endonuclease
MKTDKQKTGQWGEAMAACFLLEHKYEIIHKNYSTRRGEIDIIAWHKKPHHGRTLCFVEVKTRSYGKGSAERATGREKMKRLQSAALSYCLEHHIYVDKTPIQFEQVSVYRKKTGEPPKCIHYVIPVD